MYRINLKIDGRKEAQWLPKSWFYNAEKLICCPFISIYSNI